MSFQVSPKDYSIVPSGGCLTFEHNTAMIEKTMESLKKASDTGKAIKNAFKEKGDKFVSGAINPNNSIASKIANWLSVGASGAIMGLVGFLMVWIVINRRELAKDKSMLFRLLFLLIFVIDACFFQSGANTIAHLGGFLTGFVVGVLNIIVFKNKKDMEGIA